MINPLTNYYTDRLPLTDIAFKRRIPISPPIGDNTRFFKDHFAINAKDWRGLFNRLAETVTIERVQEAQFGGLSGQWAQDIEAAFSQYHDAELKPRMGNMIYDAGKAMSGRILRAAGKGNMPDEEKAYRFNSTTSRILAYITNEAGKLIVEIQIDTLKNIRSILAASIRKNELPQTTMQRLRKLVKLTARETGYVDNHFEALIAEGIDPFKAVKLADRYAELLARLRVERIVRTETAAAYSQANIEAMEQAVDNGLISGFKQVWRTAETERTCDLCADRDNKETDESPPAHPNCMCSLDFTLEV